MFKDSSTLHVDGARFTDVMRDYNHWDASYRPYNSHNGNYNLGANSGTSTGNVISMKTSRSRETTSVAKDFGGIAAGDVLREASASTFQRNGEMRHSNTTNSIHGYKGHRDGVKDGPTVETTAATAIPQTCTPGAAHVPLQASPLHRPQSKAQAQQKLSYPRPLVADPSRYKSNNPFRNMLLGPTDHASVSPQKLATSYPGEYPWSRREDQVPFAHSDFLHC